MFFFLKYFSIALLCHFCWRWNADVGERQHLNFLVYSSCLGFLHGDLNQVFVLARQAFTDWAISQPHGFLCSVPLICLYRWIYFGLSALFCFFVPSWCCSTVITSVTKPLDIWQCKFWSFTILVQDDLSVSFFLPLFSFLPCCGLNLVGVAPEMLALWMVVLCHRHLRMILVFQTFGEYIVLCVD